VSCSGGENTGIKSSLDCSFELDHVSNHVTTNETTWENTEGRSTGKGTYLSIKVACGYFVVALDVFLEGLTGGSVAFFELDELADFHTNHKQRRNRERWIIASNAETRAH